MSIWCTPFLDLCLLDFTVGSFFFAVQLLLIDHNTSSDSVITLLHIALWWMLMSFVTYFIRLVLTKFFVAQSEAEQNKAE